MKVKKSFRLKYGVSKDFVYVLIKLFSFFLISSCLAEPITIYGHRGARGLAPENTLPAYAEALIQGVDYVDMDIAITQDGVLVVHHDLTLNPALTRDAEGHWITRNDLAINQLTLKQLKTYDVGKINPSTDYAKLFPFQKAIDHTEIPTLKEVIDYVKKINPDVGFQIEIKTDPLHPELSEPSQAIVMALNELINEEGIIKRTKVQAFDWEVLQRLHQINPDIITAYLTDVDQEKNMHDKNPVVAGRWTGDYLLKNYHDSIPEMILELGGQWWDAEDIEITQEQINEAHQLGIKVAVWSSPQKTGKDMDLMLIEKLIAMHIDGIITDRPDLYRCSHKPDVMLFCHAAELSPVASISDSESTAGG